MIKESIGIYLGPESAVLVHVAKTPSGIEILGTKQGELASLKEHIKPAYKANSATYSRQGSDQIFEVHQEIPAELSVVAVLGARSILREYAIAFGNKQKDNARHKHTIVTSKR